MDIRRPMSDWILFHAYITFNRPMNMREMTAKVDLSYDRVRDKMREHYMEGIINKVEGGRYVLNDDNPALDLFRRLMGLDYIRPPEKLDKNGRPPKGTMFLPRKEEVITGSRRPRTLPY